MWTCILKELFEVLRILLIAVILALPNLPIREQEPVKVTVIDLKSLVPRTVVKRQVRRSMPDLERRVMTVSAYTANDWSMDGNGITASGERVQEGRTIAAPESIPFRTQIFIPALGKTFVVTDRGSAIKGDKLDLYMESRKDALAFGVQELEVLIKY